MTQNEAIKLAIKANLIMFDYDHPSLGVFAALVAEHEREACAKLIETTDLGGISSDPKLQNFIASLLFGYAQTIRARGQA